MQIILPLPIRWITRLGLLIFYGVGIWQQLQGKNFFGWLVKEHIQWTAFIIFLTVVAFAPMFFHIKRKSKTGGEYYMRKLAWFVIIVFAAVLAIAIGCAANDSFKTSVIAGLTGIFGPMYISAQNGWSNFATTVGASGTYFIIYTAAMLFAGGILFVALVRVKNSGKLPSIRSSQPTTPATPTIITTTPSGATTRPTTTTPSPTQVLAEEEVEAKG